MIRLAGNLMAQQKYAEAEPLLLESYQTLARQNALPIGEERDPLSDTKKRIVKLYESWDKPEEAAKWRIEP